MICAHKGLRLGNFSLLHTDPRDVGPVALRYPEVDFVIYHSGMSLGHAEGPYDPDDAARRRPPGKDGPKRNGLKGKNVYAEMGTAWALSMLNSEQAQHYVGKLLKYLGEDNLVWGSECLWFGSPQPQIEMFRSLQISEEFQERYGLPGAERRRSKRRSSASTGRASIASTRTRSDAPWIRVS